MKKSRAQIRSEVRTKRRSLDYNHHQDISRALSKNIIRSKLFRNSQHIALYLSNDGEVDLSMVIEKTWKLNKTCYLPILSPIFHNRLWFVPFTQDSPMAFNRFGIPEPDVNWDQVKPAYALDLIFMPLVAFDDDGNRLGMGGGFYDRTLAYLTKRNTWLKPHLVGTAFEFQRYDQLPHESWDVPMNGFVTEKELCIL